MALNLSDAERLTYTRCHAAGVPSDSSERAARLPPCATCTLSFAKTVADVGIAEELDDDLLRESAGEFACFVKRDASLSTATCERTYKARTCDLPTGIAPLGARLWASFASWALAGFDDCAPEEVGDRKQAVVIAAVELWETYCEYHINHPDLSTNPHPRGVLAWGIGKMVTFGWRAPAKHARLRKAAPLPPIMIDRDDAPDSSDASDAPDASSSSEASDTADVPAPVPDAAFSLSDSPFVARFTDLEAKIDELGTAVASHNETYATSFAEVVAAMADLTATVRKELSAVTTAIGALQDQVAALSEVPKEDNEEIDDVVGEV